MKTQEELKRIVGGFDIKGNATEIRPLGNGLINDTFKVSADGGEDYVLQRINHAIFTDVELLQSNIESVTGHIRKKLEAAGESDIDRKVLRFIPVKGGSRTWYHDGENYWRISVFIPDTVTVETVNEEYSYCAGKSFGRFEAMLADIPDKLGETIPDFHNMELRISQLREAVAHDAAGRMAEPDAKALVDQIELYADEMCKAERLHREGLLPKRICHCDTKVNNMLFDKDGNVLCIIDLDTVMPSFVFSDFGDFLRSAANTGAEDEPDTDKVNFNMNIFKAFASGYVESAKVFLTPVERENLPFAALLFPYMQAVRFLADYINGDVYYKIAYPGHNLVRTKAQWKLFQSALEHRQEMADFIASL